MIDLNPNHLATVERILAEHVPECEVRAFGSRATWTAKDYSDIDLAIVGEGPLEWRVLGRLKEAFEESSLPMRVDVLDWHDISDSFQKVIERDYVAVQKGARQGSEWQERAFEDVIDFREGPGILAKDFREHGVPLVRLAGLDRGVSVLEGCDYLDPEAVSTRWSHFQLELGDILLSTSASLGRIAVVGQEEVGAVPYTGIIRMRPKGDSLYAPYIRYLLEGPDFQQQADMVGVGSVIRHFGPMHLKQMTVRIPPLAQQRAIAHVLGTLDDKIELNRRMNETLETMARALFKSWFVDFEPVRAKMEGRDTGLPPEIAALFPDRLTPSDLGEVPEGWEVGVLNDAIEILSGGTPKTSNQEYWNGGIPWYTAKDAPSLSDIFVLTTERSISQAGVENSSTKVLPVGTTVITARGTVGRLACLGIPMAMNQTCYGLRGASGYPDYFTYWNVRNTVNDLQARTHGTIFDTITRETFKIAETVLAPVSVARTFESMLSPLMNRILDNLNESRALAAQRDALLPRLMSGEVRV